MKFRSNKKRTIGLLVIGLLLVISLGYAYLTSNMEINGFSKLFNSKWDIHFENVTIKNGSVSTTSSNEAKINPNDNTEVNYNVSFTEPGQFYEFTVDVVNAGTVDGMVNLISSKIKIGDGEEVEITDSNLPSYLSYSVTYADFSDIKKNHLLKAGNSETYKVRIEFKKDIDEGDLPDKNENIQLSFDPEYKQEDEDGEERVPNVICTYDGELVQGAEFTDGQFTYHYMQEKTQDGWDNITDEGWGVTLADKDSTEPVTTTMCNYINDKPVVSAQNMFLSSKTTSIDENKINTITLRNMNGMFNNAGNLEELDLSSFDTSNVTSMNSMFENCSSLTDLDLSSFDTSNVVSLTSMMKNTTSLENVKMDNWDLSNTSSNVGEGMFANSSVKNISCTNWKIPNYFSNWISESWAATNVEAIDVSNWDLTNTSNLYGLFKNSTKLNTITGIDTWKNTGNVNSISLMFYGTSSLLQVNLDDLDLSNVNFYDFIGGSSLKEISAKNWKTPQYATYVFNNSPALEKVDVTGWDLSNSGYLTYTFYNCPNLKEIDGLDTWNTSTIIDMNGTFSRLSSIKELDLSSFNTTNVTTTYSMFSNCTSIEKIYLGSFDTRNVTNMGCMFENCPNLERIYVINDFDTSNVTNGNYMFYGDSKLVGESRTKYFHYSGSTDVYSYAKIDGGKDSPGYFSNSNTVFGNFDVNHDSASPYKVAYTKDTTVGELPIPIRDNYEFAGWYTTASFRNKVEEDYVISEDTTFYAKWVSQSDNSRLIKGMVADVNSGKGHLYIPGDYFTIDMGKYGVQTLRIANTTTPNSCFREGQSQTACGFVLEFADILFNEKMKDVDINANDGSWEDTYLRELANTEIYNSLPQLLKNSILETYVVSGHDSDDVDENIVTQDKLYLLSFVEVWGNRINSWSYLDNSINRSSQFDFYYNSATYTNVPSGGVSYAQKNINNQGYNWWLRSASDKSYQQYVSVCSGGGSGCDNPPDNIIGFSPAFRIGTATSGYHRIRLNANGGTADKVDVYLGNGESITDLNDPTYDEYHTFVGWYTSLTNGEKIENGYIPSSDMTLYARWNELPNNKLYYNTNGGVLEDEYKRVAPDSAVGDLAVPIREGYYLDGWYSSLEGGFKVTNDYVLTSDMTVYARWKKSVQSLSFENTSITIRNPQDGAVINITNSDEIDESYSFFSNNPSVITVDQEGHIMDVSEGDTTVSVIGTTSNQTIDISVSVLYDSYIVSFYTFGGSQVNNRRVSVGTAIGTLPISTYDSYYLEGWYKESNYINKVDSSFVPTEDTALYARWAYDITYDANGGEFSDTTTEKNYTAYLENKVSHTSNVDDTGLKTTNYGGNWNNSSITGTDRGDTSKAHVVSIPGASSLTVDLYYNGEGANWDYVSLWAGSYPDYTASNNYNSTGKVTVEMGAQNNDNKFGGSQSGSYIVNGNYLTKMGHVTLTIPGDTVTFGFKSDGGGYGQGYGYYAVISGVNNVNFSDISTMNNMASQGWCDDSICANGEFDLANRTSANTRLYAKYANTLTFITNGGDINSSTKDVFVGTSVGQLPVPTKADNYFVGWYSESTLDNLVDENYVLSGSMNLYAKWRNLEYYDVTFDKNSSDAVGSMANQGMAEETPTALSTNFFTREGYRFVGWNTEPDGSGVSYLDGGDISITGNTTLYAQWVKTYNLIFDKNDNDAIGNSYSYEVLTGVSTMIPYEAFYNYKLTDKMISGYNTKNDNTEVSYYEGQYITITDDTTLYAHWSDLEVTDTIYWALQDNNSDSIDEKLIISSYPIDGSKSGTIAGDFETSSYYNIPWVAGYSDNNLSNNVSEVEFKGLVVPKSTTCWFNDVGYNSSSFMINLDNLNTSFVTNMNYMFFGAGYNATTLNLGDLSSLDVSNVLYMKYLFSGAGYNNTTWNIGDLSNWDVSKVKTMEGMFQDAGYSASNFDISFIEVWNVSSVVDMQYMFNRAGYSATSWSIGDLDDWNTSKVTSMESMFSFAGGNATTWSVGNIRNWNISKVKNMKYMFQGAGYSVSSFSLDLSGWNTNKVTSLSYMFNNSGYNSSTFSVNMSGWNTSRVLSMSNMFDSAGHSATIWNITGLSSWNTSCVSSMSYMFDSAGYNATTWSVGDISNWNTSNVEYMTYTFNDAGYNSSTFSLDISGWNTSKVRNFNNVFNNTGYSATSFSIIIPINNGNNISNTTSRLYGSNSNYYASPPTDRVFTLSS